MKAETLSTYLSLASGLWVIGASTLWGLLPDLAPHWYDFKASVLLPLFALSYLLLAAGLWLGSRRAGLAMVVLLLAGSLVWFTLAGPTLSITDLASISLLLATALAVLAALRRRAKSTFHPLDYPVYG